MNDAHRFPFGRNWRRFLRLVNEERIDHAERSLRSMLGRDRLDATSFLDIGCGSGLFSLAARRLGALVHPFDNDPESVACATILKRRHSDGDNQWIIEEGSVLDDSFMASVGRFDIVYAWGSLHHTGDLWGALARSAQHVNPNGVLYVSIYLDRGLRSVIWSHIKRTYTSSRMGRLVVLSLFFPYFAIRGLVEDVYRGRNPVRRYTAYASEHRGMSQLYDWIDWLGGYPCEFAHPGEVNRFMENLGSVSQKRCGMEYVFARRT